MCSHVLFIIEQHSAPQVVLGSVQVRTLRLPRFQSVGHVLGESGVLILQQFGYISRRIESYHGREYLPQSRRHLPRSCFRQCLVTDRIAGHHLPCCECILLCGMYEALVRSKIDERSRSLHAVQKQPHVVQIAHGGMKATNPTNHRWRIIR